MNLTKKSAIAALACFYSIVTIAQQQDNQTPQSTVATNEQDKPMDHSSTDQSAMGHDSNSKMDSMQGMDHSIMKLKDASIEDKPMDYSAMGHDSNSKMDSMQGMDHSKMKPKDAETEDKPMDHSKMDHGNMPAQSNTPPPDARDPHAYSDGLTLDSGAYALPGPRQLKMADEHAFWTVLFDRFEYADGLSSGISNATQYDMQAWYGDSYNRIVVKSEGEIVNNKLEESENKILWGHAISSFWDLQSGVKLDTSEGPSRQWLTVGLQGLAPYWFEVDTSLSVGTQGRTAFDLEAEYELLITQRLVLQPRVAVSAYGKDDELNAVGRGLSSITAGIRLRYEFSRQFAPYLGVEWTGQYGNTADFSILGGRSTRIIQWVAGIRFWFQ